MLQRKYIIYRVSDHEDEQGRKKNGVLPDIMERIHREKAVTDTLTHIRTSIQNKVLKDVPNKQEIIDNFEQAISDVKDNLFKEKIVREKWWKELNDVLTEIKGLCDTTNTRTLYLHLIFHGIRQLPAKHILNLIKEVLPQAIVTGMTETLFETAKGAEYVMISANFFRYSEIKLLQFDGTPTDYAQEGKRMGEIIAAYPDAKAAAVYCSCMETEFSLFFSNMTGVNSDIVFFGASAGVFGKINEIISSSKNLLLLDQQNIQDNQFIVGNQILSTGIVVAVFCGEELHVQGDYTLGWKPLGKELTITEANGINCIAKLDGIPATDIYYHYLRVVPDENFVFNIAEFPLVIERNGCLIPRVPPIHDDDGRIYFNGDIYEGEKVRLTYAVPAELLQKSAKNSDKMCDFSPEALFLTICGNRTMFLHEAADEEIGFYKRFVPHLITNYGTSEIYFNKGQGGILNSALIAVGFREGEPSDHCVCHPLIQHKEQHNVIPLAARMATFLDAMTQELTQSNKDLKDMAERAKAANRAKSDFLSNMSHEIRTPINAILGMDEMILRECTDDTIRNYAENIRTAGNTLLGLINDILDFSKIEAGKLELIPAEYATSSILNDLVNMIAGRVAKKGLKFIVKAAQDLPSMLLGDELRLRQIITNILTNAVKYTEKGSVTLSVNWEKLSDDEVLLKVAVTDTGIGIKEEDIHKLFRAFERIEEERNRTVEGTGLGMNITQKLLSMMDSHLDVTSTYGEGSCFSFEVKQKVLNWAAMGNYEEAYRRSQAERHNDNQSFVAPEARILVVDDTEMNLTVVKGLLKRTQIQIDTAVSGYQCIDMVKENTYDAIFLDHRMPGMDGIETLTELKKLTDCPNANTPVIALTANAVAGAREEYFKAGFDDYITKPIDSRQLEHCLIKYLPETKVKYQTGELQQVAEEITLPAWLSSVPGLDTESGIKHCGSVEAYLSALTVFAESLPRTAEEIQRFFANCECDNYTTKVHALKSTARVAGLNELSERARRLEDAGNNCYLEELTTDTPILLSLCRDYAKALAPLTEKSEPEEENKVPISDAELMEAWETIGDIVKTFDYDNLMYLLGELAGYRLEAKDRKKLQALQEAAKLPDWEKLQELMKQG